MNLRQRTDSRSRFDRLRDRVRSSLGTDSTAATADAEVDAGGESTDDTIGNLFQCSTCRVVYIAAEKEICSNCENDVERVRSTFAHQ